jgi:hypothetical protein
MSEQLRNLYDVHRKNISEEYISEENISEKNYTSQKILILILFLENYAPLFDPYGYEIIETHLKNILSAFKDKEYGFYNINKKIKKLLTDTSLKSKYLKYKKKYLLLQKNYFTPLHIADF